MWHVQGKKYDWAIVGLVAKDASTLLSGWHKGKGYSRLLLRQVY
jgi:hypothetical protein